MSELWQHDATDLHALFMKGESSASEIVEAHLARIDAVNPSVNAVVRRIDDEARATAAAVDDARAAGHDLGALAGVPFTIKDNLDLAGDPTTMGVKALADWVPETDSPVVERMKRAGAVPLARTNLPDLGLRLHTDSELHGLTRNPWNRERTVGGSSGGEGAALATGMSPIGLGNDLGGSLRNPATCCSIASLKPSLGRIPHALEGLFAAGSIVEQVLAVEGPMARTIADVRLGLHVLAGSHPRDPWSMPVPVADRPVQRRVAVVADPPGGATDPRVAAVTRQAADAISSAGYVVEEAMPPGYADVLSCWTTLVIGSLGVGMPLLEPVLGPDGMAFLEAGSRQTLAGLGPMALEEAWMERSNLIRTWNEFFAQWDAMLTPTWTQLPFEHAYDLGPGGAEGVLELARPVLPANVLGLPSVAVPAGLVDGLPVGVIVNGPAWSEIVCLDIAEAIESAGLAPPTPIDPVV